MHTPGTTSKNHKLQLWEKRIQSAHEFSLDVLILRGSSSEATQEHVETLIKEAFDKLQAQVLALRMRREANDGGCITQSSVLCIAGVCFLGHSLLP